MDKIIAVVVMGIVLVILEYRKSQGNLGEEKYILAIVFSIAFLYGFVDLAVEAFRAGFLSDAPKIPGLQYIVR